MKLIAEQRLATSEVHSASARLKVAHWAAVGSV
jgi:hypothetical protein